MRSRSIDHQIGYKAFVIFLQETHCTNADQLVIPNFTQADLISSRKHGLAKFIYKKLSWPMTDQSPE